MKKHLIFKTVIMAIIGIFLTGAIASAADSSKTSEAVIKTSAYDWTHKDAIEKKLSGIDGVKEVIVDLEEKTITVNYDANKVSSETLVYAVIELGYEAQIVAVKEKSKVSGEEKEIVIKK